MASGPETRLDARNGAGRPVGAGGWFAGFWSLFDHLRRCERRTFEDFGRAQVTSLEPLWERAALWPEGFTKAGVAVECTASILIQKRMHTEIHPQSLAKLPYSQLLHAPCHCAIGVVG